MKLWLLRPRYSKEFGSSSLHSASWGYDCVDGFVIAAPTEKRAREIADENAEGENNVLEGLKPWIDKDYSTCKKLTDDEKEGVILMDVNWG